MDLNKLKEDILQAIARETPLAPFTYPIGGGAVVKSGASAVGGGAKAAYDAATETGRGLLFAVGFMANPQNWLRAAEAIAGAVLILVGLLMIAHRTETGQAVEGKVGQAATVAAVA